jgi:hypothetical protein
MITASPRPLLIAAIKVPVPSACHAARGCPDFQEAEPTVVAWRRRQRRLARRLVAVRWRAVLFSANSSRICASSQGFSWESSLSHGENRGSSPLGSANENNHLFKIQSLVSNNCPINLYGQAWTACGLLNPEQYRILATLDVAAALRIGIASTPWQTRRRLAYSPASTTNRAPPPRGPTPWPPCG